MTLGVYEALFDFVAERESDLSLNVGDIVFVSRKINNDWYEGFSNNKCGHFPSCYVKMIFNSTPERVGVVLSNFKGDQSHHLPLIKGDVIGLTGVIDEQWSSGYSISAKGLFPTHFVKEITIPNDAILPQVDLINNKISSSNDNLDEIEKNKLEKSTTLKTKMKPNILPKPKLKKDKNLIQNDYQFELIEEKIFDICDNAKKEPVVKRKAPPKPNITKTNSTPNDSLNVQSNHINKEVLNRKKSQPRSPINIKNIPSISHHSDIATLPISSLNNNCLTSRPNLMTVSFSKEKQLEFSSSLSGYENDSHLLKDSKKITSKISLDKNVFPYSHRRSPNIQEKQDDLCFVQPVNSTEKSNTNMQRHDLHQIDTEIAQLKSKLEFESHQLAGVETLLDVVSEENRKDLYIKKEHHESVITEINDSLHALEDEKSYVLASFGKVEDVKNRVNELEKQIEQYLNNCEQLRCMQDFSDIEELPEIRDNIIFCENMVDTLQDELSGLREKLGELDQLDGNDPEQMIQKRKKKLHNIVEELINTEESFISDISFLTDKIKVKLETEESINISILFGNLDEILVVSRKLLTALKNAYGDSLDQISNKIASCFLALSMEMKECYAIYCHNYDDVQSLLEKFEEEPDIQEKISKAFLLEGNNFGSMSLPSMLIKPVQRVLKYPLLLNELLKNSIDASNCELKSALNTMNDVAAAINEFKRRKDLVLKYREIIPGIGKKVQKLNWHSVAKKSSRINQRITQFTGLNSQTVDQKFIYEEKRFRTIEKMIKLVLKNVNQYMEIFKENSFSELQCAESLRQFHDSPNPPDEIVKYYGRIYMIAEQYSSQMVSFILQHVQEPLNQVLQMFQGPFRLIQKRNDKCLDFDRAANKAARARDTKERDKIMQTQDELNEIRNVYIALNTQLLEELPILSEKCSIFLQYCLSSFVEAYIRYLRKCCVQINEVSKLPFLSKDSDIEFFMKASEQLSSLIFTPSFNGKESSKKPFLSPNFINDHEDVNMYQASFSQLSSTLYGSIDQTTSSSKSFSSEDQSTILSESNSENPIFVVKFDFTAECDAEITVQEGTTVNVCRMCDSKGNSDWWLVEQDGAKGYIPKSFLIMKSVNEKHLTSQTQFENLHKDQYIGNTTFYVEYNFQAINPGELTVNEGQTVQVICKHDSKGNNEWWLVEYDGKQGFVPQDYLKSNNKP